MEAQPLPCGAAALRLRLGLPQLRRQPQHLALPLLLAALRPRLGMLLVLLRPLLRQVPFPGRPRPCRRRAQAAALLLAALRPASECPSAALRPAPLLLAALRPRLGLPQLRRQPQAAPLLLAALRLGFAS